MWLLIGLFTFVTHCVEIFTLVHTVPDTQKENNDRHLKKEDEIEK